jgi:hypothetical protein
MDNQPAATNQRPAKRSQTLVAEVVINSTPKRLKGPPGKPPGFKSTPGAKRNLPESPNKEEGKSKRRRRATVIITDDEEESAAGSSENGIAAGEEIATLQTDSGNDSDAEVEPTPADLSLETHLEGSRLNRNRFPQAKNEVCGPKFDVLCSG